MFIQNLTEKQQEVFLALANDLIHADGVLEDQELELLSILKAQTNEGIEAGVYNLNELGDIFDTKVSKFSVLFELIGLGHADQDFDLAEKKMVLDIAESMGLTAENVQDIDFWVTRQISLFAEANTMMED